MTSQLDLGRVDEFDHLLRSACTCHRRNNPGFREQPGKSDGGDTRLLLARDLIENGEDALATLGEVIGQFRSPIIGAEIPLRAVFAGEEATGEGESWHYGETLLTGHASEIPFVAGAVHEVVMILHGEHRRDSELCGNHPSLDEAIARVI